MHCILDEGLNELRKSTYVFCVVDIILERETFHLKP